MFSSILSLETLPYTAAEDENINLFNQDNSNNQEQKVFEDEYNAMEEDFEIPAFLRKQKI